MMRTISYVLYYNGYIIWLKSYDLPCGRWRKNRRKPFLTLFLSWSAGCASFYIDSSSDKRKSDLMPCRVSFSTLTSSLTIRKSWRPTRKGAQSSARSGLRRQRYVLLRWRTRSHWALWTRRQKTRWISRLIRWHQSRYEALQRAALVLAFSRLQMARLCPILQVPTRSRPWKLWSNRLRKLLRLSPGRSLSKILSTQTIDLSRKQTKI